MSPADTAPAPGAGLTDSARRLLAVAVAALARREHSSAEIRRKLLRRLQPGESPDDIAPVLASLQARGLLSDQRMAQVLARSRSQRYGGLRIRQELERRGVDRETIAAVLPAPEQQAAAAFSLWQRKFGVRPVNRQEYARQGRFLAARGFAPALIARVLAASADSATESSS
jgi:regulatory protein